MERDEWLRAAWRMVDKKVEPKRLVFVGEMGANTSLSVMRAWSRTGERAYCSVPRNRGRNTTLLASMAASGMGPTLAVEGATNREVFEAYVEEVLTQSLHRSCSPIEKTQPWLTPVGGLAHGWKQVAETMERAASSRRDGETVGFEIEVKHVTPELAYMWR